MLHDASKGWRTGEIRYIARYGSSRPQGGLPHHERAAVKTEVDLLFAIIELALRQ